MQACWILHIATLVGDAIQLLVFFSKAMAIHMHVSRVTRVIPWVMSMSCKSPFPILLQRLIYVNLHNCCCDPFKKHWRCVHLHLQVASTTLIREHQSLSMRNVDFMLRGPVAIDLFSSLICIVSITEILLMPFSRSIPQKISHFKTGAKLEKVGYNSCSSPME